jgi:hypothetical protein
LLTGKWRNRAFWCVWQKIGIFVLSNSHACSVSIRASMRQRNLDSNPVAPTISFCILSGSDIFKSFDFFVFAACQSPCSTADFSKINQGKETYEQ